MSDQICTVMQSVTHRNESMKIHQCLSDCKWVHERLGGSEPFTPDDSLLRPSTHRSPSRSTLINWLSKMCRINGLTTPRLQCWSSGLRLGKPRPATQWPLPSRPRAVLPQMWIRDVWVDCVSLAWFERTALSCCGALRWQLITGICLVYW